MLETITLIPWFDVLLIPVLLFGMLARCLIGSLIGATILRSSCSAFNWFVASGDGDGDASTVEPPEKPQPVSVKVSLSELSNDKDTAVSGNPYSSPVTPLGSAYPDGPDPGNGVPQPNYGKAFLICVTASVLQIGLELGAGILVAVIISWAQLGSTFAPVFSCLQIFCLGCGFVLFSWLTARQLPTSPQKARRVAGLFYAVWILIAVFVGVFAALMMLAT